LSAIGLGSAAESGCHLLGFVVPAADPAPVDAPLVLMLRSLGGILGEALYASMSSTSSLKATRLPSDDGLGDLEGGGGLKTLGLLRLS